ncbi:MAG: 3-oxoacid CoA-transferase subunit A [Alphaproteobacteria bacterium]|nr:3-oxoacid CoA-transferase subunit A [Alphaproteobacteria bacterium]
MIDKRVQTLADALDGVADGCRIMVHGFGVAGVPEALLNALLERGTTGLTIIANGAGRADSAMQKLFAAGRIAKLIASSGRGRSVEPSPFEAGWKAGRVEFEIVPQGIFVERMRCAGAGLGGFYSPVGVGTKLAAGKEVRAIAGRDYVLEMPLTADVALLHAERGDRWGNLSYRYAERNFGPAMATAAALVVAEVDKIVELGDIAPMDAHTPGVFVDRLVEVT